MKGIGVSPGISIGNAFVIQKNETAMTGVPVAGETAVPDEIDKFDKAVAGATNDIENIKKNSTDLAADALEILETQIELLTDPQIREDVVRKIEKEKKNSTDAVSEVIQASVLLFKKMKDEYFSARAADIQDIGNRILKHLNQDRGGKDLSLSEDTIIIAEDLAPSDTITLDISRVIGFATQAGGRTSHAAIIAKSRGIPAVVGCGIELQSVKTSDVIILDGTEGTIIVNPERKQIEEYLLRKKSFSERQAFAKSLKDVPAVTLDGVKIALEANIGKAEDWAQVFESGGEGVGLLRTELLFMERNSFPTEEEQFIFYKKVAMQSKNKPVTVRTLDIGGDKSLPYFGLPAEQNPFLGYRAIRICLDRKDIFITQLKAVLRAGVFGDLRIMFPMICNVQEVKRAKAILEEAKQELARQNISFRDDIKTGIMVEVPSAAVTADLLAKEVDFFSIGTNDLCQYTLAVDRMNEKIKDLYDPFNPGVLRLIRYVIEQGDKNGIPVAMCGELASDPLATRLLLGMGLREFSMSATSIPAIKNVIVNSDLAAAQAVCKKVMEMDSSQIILKYLTDISH